MRVPIVAGNWKMNGSSAEAVALAGGILDRLAGFGGVEVVLCPPFTALQPVSKLLAGSSIALGAQDVHWEPSGPWTGEVSAIMLADLACRYVIVGHSERRSHFGETDVIVNRKARAVLRVGLNPIVCVGETLAQREAGDTEEVVRSQLDACLVDLGDGLRETVIAYEPVWAIGTGRRATAEQAQAVHSLIRDGVGALAGREIARAVRIQYGGSLAPADAGEIFRQPDVDGGLVGGASLDADSFVSIVLAAAAGG